MIPEPMDEARLADLLAVMDADRLAGHVAGLRAALCGLAGDEAPPLPATPQAQTDLTPGARTDLAPEARADLAPEARTDRAPEARTDRAPEAWSGLARRAHSAAGHAQLLGFPAIGRLLNDLESAAKAQDPRAAALALAGLRAQLDAGGPRLPPI